VDSLPLLVLYHTTAYGDRPRWREAALAVKSQVDLGSAEPVVYAHSRGVIAHYLGVPPSETMGHPSVTGWPGVARFGDSQGYVIVIEADLGPQGRLWLRNNCKLIVSLPATMVVRDRGVVVYSCIGRRPPPS
jgi:hypothetical protein